MNLARGQLVKSMAGRDIGEYFLVYELIDEDYVKIVNGESRKLEKPKLKKIKHLSKTNKISAVIDELNTSDIRSQNKKISKEIANLLEIK